MKRTAPAFGLSLLLVAAGATGAAAAWTASASFSLSFTTQGDNNAAADPAPVTEPQVKGRVWYSVPWVGYLNATAGGAPAWLVIAVAAALFVYAGWMIAGAALSDRARRARAAAAEGVEPVRPPART